MKRLRPKSENAIAGRLRYLLDLVENGAPVDHLERRMQDSARLFLGPDGRFLAEHVEDVDYGPKPPASLAPTEAEAAAMRDPQGES